MSSTSLCLMTFYDVIKNKQEGMHVGGMQNANFSLLIIPCLMSSSVFAVEAQVHVVALYRTPPSRRQPKEFSLNELSCVMVEFGDGDLVS